jgi:hypothetical protein
MIEFCSRKFSFLLFPLFFYGFLEFDIFGGL